MWRAERGYQGAMRVWFAVPPDGDGVAMRNEGEAKVFAEAMNLRVLKHKAASVSVPHRDAVEIRAALIALAESACQAPEDFCGEQREWHLPRIKRAWVTFMGLFPAMAIEAMQAAKSPDGFSALAE